MALRARTRTLSDLVVFERSGAWWAAEMPAFPGAYGQGKTRIAAYRNLLSAVRDLIDTYAEEARDKAFFKLLDAAFIERPIRAAKSPRVASRKPSRSLKIAAARRV